VYVILAHRSFIYVVHITYRESQNTPFECKKMLSALY